MENKVRCTHFLEFCREDFLSHDSRCREVTAALHIEVTAAPNMEGKAAAVKSQRSPKVASARQRPPKGTAEVWSRSARQWSPKFALAHQKPPKVTAEV